MLVLNTNNRTLTWEGRIEQVTPPTAKMLEVIMHATPNAATWSQMASAVWRESGKEPEHLFGVMNVMMCRLRVKFPCLPIKTVRCVGYRCTAPVEIIGADREVWISRRLARAIVSLLYLHQDTTAAALIIRQMQACSNAL